jgi:hypothetical protein
MGRDHWLCPLSSRDQNRLATPTNDHCTRYTVSRVLRISEIGLAVPDVSAAVATLQCSSAAGGRHDCQLSNRDLMWQ